MRVGTPAYWHRGNQHLASEMPAIEGQVRGFSEHLEKHSIRIHVKEYCEQNGHSFKEEIEVDDERITLCTTIGGKEKGNTNYECFRFEDFDRRDDLDYKWDTIILHYARVLESYIDGKNIIPKDLC